MHKHIPPLQPSAIHNHIRSEQPVSVVTVDGTKKAPFKSCTAVWNDSVTLVFQNPITNLANSNSFIGQHVFPQAPRKYMQASDKQSRSRATPQSSQSWSHGSLGTRVPLSAGQLWTENIACQSGFISRLKTLTCNRLLFNSLKCNSLLFSL